MTNINEEIEDGYINEIIRVNYKCNWSCKFCNVLKTNNYWRNDVSSKKIILNILELVKKYTIEQRKHLTLSFSWWEPTLNKNLLSFIRLAKKIWIWTVEIQTNGTILFKNKDYIYELMDAWLDEIFLAQHSWDEIINKELWSYYNIEDFKKWVKFVQENKLDKKISIYLNIVVTKINIFSICDFISMLLQIWFIDIIPKDQDEKGKYTHKISFWYCQPNGYAELNKDQVLLDFWKEQIVEIDKIVELCQKNNILPDFHFTAPPICVLDYKEYNLEYSRLKTLEQNTEDGEINEWNLESYKWLWKEKRKFDECKQCSNNKYCLWMYKNWINFVWEDYAKDKILSYLSQ